MISRLLFLLQRFAWKRPRVILGLLVLLIVGAAAASARLKFSSDIVNILPRSSPAVDAVQEVLGHFAFTGQLFVFVEKTRPDASEEAAMKLADGIGERMRRSPEVTSVDWKITKESEEFLGRMVTERGPLLIPDGKMPEFLKRFETAEIRKTVKKNRRRLSGPGPGLADMLAGRDPLDLTRDFYLPILNAGRPQGKFDLSTGYYFCEGRTALIFTVEGAKPPHDVEFGEKLVALAQKSIAEARAETPGSDGWSVSLLGGYPIALANEKAIRDDMGITILGSVPPLMLMLIISLRRWLSLAIGFVALNIGILWTFGLAGAVYGHLTGVTVGFAGLLAGMGIDFTIHFYNRYFVERDTGLPPDEACGKVYSGGAPSVFVAMITSAASLMCLWVSQFVGLREFATLVGAGLVLVFIATALSFPLFIRTCAPRGWADREVPRWIFGGSWVAFAVYLAISAYYVPALGLATAAACILLLTDWGQRATTWALVKRPSVAATLAVAGTIVASVALFRPPAGLPPRETDVKNLRTEGDVILKIQERMRDAFGSGMDPLMIVSRGATEGEALERADAVVRSVSALQDVAVSGITQFVPPPSQQRRRAAEVSNVDAERVLRDLDAALDAEGFEPAAFEEARKTLRTALAVRDPVSPSSLDDPFFRSIRGRFLSTGAGDGRVRVLTWVTPRDPLHVREVRERVINEIDGAAKRGDPQSTMSGFNVVVKELDERIGPDIGKATLCAGALTFVLACILFRSLPWALLALLPSCVGTLWMLGVFRLMDVRMNYLSLIVYPLMMGMGTDNGLYLVYRFRELGCRDAARTVSSLWRGLTLTALTTVVGFGSLAFASNLAMRSLGVAISVGMLSYLFATLLVLPPLLRRLEHWKESVRPE